jgi:hypothetical protein
MRAQGPLHEGHLAEAVRRGLITDDQREAILAMARSESIDAAVNVADLRWTVVVQGVAASLVAVLPGIAILAEASDENPVVLMLASLFAVMVFGAFGWIARERGWGRVPAAIFTAAMAPYAGGVAMFALDAGWRSVLGRGRADQMLSGALTSRDVDLTWAALLATGALVAVGASWVIARGRANGPVWAVPAVALTPLAIALCIVFDTGSESERGICVTLLAVALAGVSAAWALRARLQRGGVDGASWFELGVFAPLLAVLVGRMTNHTGEMAAWIAAASIVAVGGVRTRRWTYQLMGALGLFATMLVGFRHESVAMRAGVVVALATVLAAAAHSMRRTEAERALREPPRAAMTYWE